MKKYVVAFLGLFGISFQAAADLPASVGTSLTAIQTDALAGIDLVWPIMLGVLSALIVMKLVKRAANKI